MYSRTLQVQVSSEICPLIPLTYICGKGGGVFSDLPYCILFSETVLMTVTFVTMRNKGNLNQFLILANSTRLHLCYSVFIE